MHVKIILMSPMNTVVHVQSIIVQCKRGVLKHKNITLCSCFADPLPLASHSQGKGHWTIPTMGTRIRLFDMPTHILSLLVALHAKLYQLKNILNVIIQWFFKGKVINRDACAPTQDLYALSPTLLMLLKVRSVDLSHVTMQRQSV